MRPAIILFIICFSLPALADSATLKVPSQYATIQDAIDASVNGDTVLVAPGTYVENIDFKGKAITVTSEQGAEVTVMDGNQAERVVTCKSGEGPDSVLEGFTITNGEGGMRNIFSSPTVINCSFIENTYFYGGGGMYNGESSTTVTNCIFDGNSAHDGGGMYNSSSNPTVTNCTFFKNSASESGGGMANILNSDATLINCTFSGNTAVLSGGGMENYVSSVIVTNCTFNANSTGVGGGAIYNEYSGTTVTNCIFDGNSAHDGGGMYNSNSNPTVTNCTFSKNSSSESGGGIADYLICYTTITNSILWNDIPDEINSVGTVTYSDVKGGWPGTGNIDADPLFVDPINGDFHLTFPSPCKDSGDNSAVTELYDFEGDPRIAYGTVDMGADEFYTHLYYTGDATPGGNVEIKFVGLPGTAPVGLCIGTGVLDPPLKSMWGDWYLAFPIIGPVDMSSIPTTGVLVIPGTIPSTPPAPYSIPMQALIGAELSNLSVLEIK